MNVLLISQCDKRALTESRRILDQFAERRGDRTWQTPVTQDGLDTLRRLLRKSARKNTAVACHWIRGLDHSELLWVVGDASRFNAQGAVPTNTTARNVLRKEGENDWHTGEDIHLLTGLAALLHDLGKASASFQSRLKGDGAPERNLYRHEWVSLRLFAAFVGKDDDARWLRRLAAPSPQDDASWLDNGRLLRDGLDATVPPFPTLPPLAQAVGWLVLTHHRLPVLPGSVNGKPLWLGAKVPGFGLAQLSNVLAFVDAGWNERCALTDRKAIAPYWTFAHGLPVTTEAWRKRAARLALRLSKLVETPGKGDWIANPYVMHVSRLSLMLADHHYSGLDPASVERAKVPAGYPLHANTHRPTGALNQTLDEHLIGVAQHSAEICHALPGFERNLPHLARHKGLAKRSEDPRFRWQDKAADVAAAMRPAAAAGGAFIVNMASTGCGKTLANARVMYALAEPAHGMRCTFALGLRTLTLQTGRVYRDALHLRDDDLAIRVGGTASRQLFEHYEALAERNGSASVQDLVTEDGHVHFDGNINAHPLLQKAMHDPQVRVLLSAPVLTCTIDHLTPATESQRGGRQIAPMLRLMSSDLVLDELDDFDIDDLPAVARLVHWAGMLGARVLISSATLPPALVQGMFDAYRDGRTLYARNRGDRPGQAPTIACAWIDEFHQEPQPCADTASFAAAHLAFARKRHAALGRAPVRRRAALLPLALGGMSTDDARRAAFALLVRAAAVRLHRQHHAADPASGKRVSFGLVRMAHIEPLYDVALALYRLGAPEGMRIHLCVYHSQYPLLLRSAIERRLDAALDRRDAPAVWRLPDIRQALDADPETDQLFIVLGSPVTEVGRDHDYDWAVVEPSSMRSLIQLAGRVWRHRPLRECAAESPNLLVFDSNLQHWKNTDAAAFCRPGFELNSGEFRLDSHSLADLLRADERDAIDSRPRILPRDDDALRPTQSLVDLEHARLRRTMLPARTEPPAPPAPGSRRQPLGGPGGFASLAACHWWHLPRADALMTALLPQHQPFRADSQTRIELCFLPDADGFGYLLHYVADKHRGPALYIPIERARHTPIPDADVHGPRIAPWSEPDYMQALTELAAERGMSLEDCAQRFGKVSVPDHDGGWRFHAALGFSRCR